MQEKQPKTIAAGTESARQEERSEIYRSLAGGGS